MITTYFGEWLLCDLVFVNVSKGIMTAFVHPSFGNFPGFLLSRWKWFQRFVVETSDHLDWAKLIYKNFQGHLYQEILQNLCVIVFRFDCLFFFLICKLRARMTRPVSKQNTLWKLLNSGIWETWCVLLWKWLNWNRISKNLGFKISIEINFWTSRLSCFI